MNNRNDILRTREDVVEYLKKVCKNAEKHGLYLTIIMGECAYLSELTNVINYEVMKNQRKADTFAALFELQKEILHWHILSESDKKEVRELMAEEWRKMDDNNELLSMQERTECGPIFKKRDNRGKN